MTIFFNKGAYIPCTYCGTIHGHVYTFKRTQDGGSQQNMCETCLTELVKFHSEMKSLKPKGK